MIKSPATLAKSGLSKREKEVCARIREARIAAGITLSSLSRMLKISRATLKNYEYGRTAVRFDVGERISAIVNCNQRWLASGAPPAHPHFTISNPLILALDRPRLRLQMFSRIYDAILSKGFDERFEILARSYWRMPTKISPATREPDLPGIGFGASATRYFVAQLLGKKVAARASRFPDKALSEIEADIDSLVHRYEKKYKTEIDSLAERLLFDAAAEFVEMESDIESKLGPDET